VLKNGGSKVSLGDHAVEFLHKNLIRLLSIILLVSMQSAVREEQGCNRMLFISKPLFEKFNKKELNTETIADP
jgi:hypothetical protein